MDRDRMFYCSMCHQDFHRDDTDEVYDNYGIYAGRFCVKCAEKKRKYLSTWVFDPSYAGERLDDDY